MFILLIMAIGFVVGYIFFPNKKLKISEVIQMVAIYLLIFTMGVILGQDDTFFEKLHTLGLYSFIFAIVTIIFSVFVVYFLTLKFMQKKGKLK